jgi:beta-glucosidase
LSGDYEFGLFSTGRALLYVDGELLVDNWNETAPGQAFFTQATTEKRGLVRMTQNQRVKVRIEFEANPDNNFKVVRYGVLPPQPEDSIADAVLIAKNADVVLLLVGTNDDWETEGNDREMLELPGDQTALIKQVVNANPNTVVVNNSGSPVAMPWLDDVPAAIQSWFPGQEFGHALVDLLLGSVNPSGKLPITFPKQLEDTPAFTSYPGEFGQVHYGEGLFVGYRWYDTRDIDPLLAFGHGLSYTSFEYSNLSVTGFDKEPHGDITFSLSNTGDCAGMETAQVYVEPLDSPVARAKRELKAFVKLDLAAGETRNVTIALDAEAFAHWDLGESGWLVAPGWYRIHVGSSSRDLRLVKEIETDGGPLSSGSRAASF